MLKVTLENVEKCWMSVSLNVHCMWDIWCTVGWDFHALSIEVSILFSHPSFWCCYHVISFKSIASIASFWLLIHLLWSHGFQTDKNVETAMEYLLKEQDTYILSDNGWCRELQWHFAVVIIYRILETTHRKTYASKTTSSCPNF
jgi:hypothetical protein